MEVQMMGSHTYYLYKYKEQQDNVSLLCVNGLGEYVDYSDEEQSDYVGSE